MKLFSRIASKVIVLLLYSAPVFYIVYGFQNSIEPVEKLLETTGFSAINLLTLSLSGAIIRHFRVHRLLTVVAKHAGYGSLVYGISHIAIYLFLDQGMSINAIIEDLVKHPRIIAGTLALLGLTLAGLAGLKPVKKSPKFRKPLLRMSYPAGILAGYHYMEAVKHDITIPLIYVIILSTFVTIRLLLIFRKRRKSVS